MKKRINFVYKEMLFLLTYKFVYGIIYIMISGGCISMLAIFMDSANYLEKKVVYGDFALVGGKIISLDNIDIDVLQGESAPVFHNCIILPGFCDVHVHFREPGFLYKEDIFSGSSSAAAGGYTHVCTMPNLNPVPDSKENLQIQLDAIKDKACIGVHPYGALTVGEAGKVPSDIDGMAESVVAFSDDGRGVQSEAMMRELMLKVKKTDRVLAAHCEDNSLLRGGYIHDGEYAQAHGHKGISSESEWGQIKRDISLAAQTGVKYHVCHISAKESVALIRDAKAHGVNITCETGPHYLILDDSSLEEHGRFKMNPPLRSSADREALVEGLLDGTIDMIATDHAPHSAEEKSRGLEHSAMGVVGLESAFPEMYTRFVKSGIITLERLLELMVYNPRERFGIEGDVGFCVWKTDEEYKINPDKFKTMGRATPFEGDSVFGKCLFTVYNGQTVYSNEDIK